MRYQLITLLLAIITTTGFGQKSTKIPRFFGDLVVADSSTTLMIPIRYNSDLLASSKIALWGDYYSNILFYDFITDSVKRLFKDDTFIKEFSNMNSSYYGYDRNASKPESDCRKWIFYFVKQADFDKSGRIDNTDPSILFASDRYGNDLKAITPDNENAISIDIFDKQGIAMIKMQRDFDNDKDFELNDKDYYFIRLDLNTLTLGHKIEIKK
jgi:hypothetical protein